MINVTIENEELSITIKDNDAYSIEDCVDLLSRAATAVFGECIELLLDNADPTEWVEDANLNRDKTIYIEKNQPHDHVVHEGM